MSYQQQFDQVESWVNAIRPHWIRCAGNLHNDPKFWRECIHNTTPQMWQDIIDVFNYIDQATDLAKRHTYITGDLLEIQNRINTNKKITIPYNREGYNKPVFRATMAFKDIIAQATDRPFTKVVPGPVQTATASQAKIDKQALAMKKWEQARDAIDALFVTEE